MARFPTPAVPELQAEVGGNARFITVFDQAPFIVQSIETLATELEEVLA